jgi:hypothetical protein
MNAAFGELNKMEKKQDSLIRSNERLKEENDSFISKIES